MRLLKRLDEVAGGYRERVRRHRAGSRKLDAKTLLEFARYLHASNTRWNALLVLMQGKCDHPAFKRALHANMMSELGTATNPSHPTLCLAFTRSLGLELGVGLAQPMSRIGQHEATVIDSMTSPRMTQAEICGWAMVAEATFGEMLSLVRDQFISLGADTRYLDEHIRGDDKHADMMREAASAMLEESETVFDDLLLGLEMGGDSALSVLNDILAFDGTLPNVQAPTLAA